MASDNFYDLRLTQVLYRFSQVAELLGYTDEGIIHELLDAGKLRVTRLHPNAKPRIHVREIQRLAEELDPLCHSIANIPEPIKPRDAKRKSKSSTSDGLIPPANGTSALPPSMESKILNLRERGKQPAKSKQPATSTNRPGKS